MKRLLILVLAAAACLSVQASAPRAPQESGRDIVDTMLTVDRFDTFLMLIREADLTFALKRSGPYTVFAPDNEAFNALGATRLENLRSNKSALRSFLMRHIVYGRYSAERAVRVGSIRTWTGSMLRFENIDEHGTIMGRAHFTGANIQTSNGYIHEIDSVL